MKRTFSLVAIGALALFAVGFGPGVAAAGDEIGTAPDQEAGEIEAGDELANATDQAGDGLANATGTAVDSQIRLVDWTFSDGSFSLTFINSGERPATVTLTEATQPGEGVSRYSTQTERLLPGRSTLTMTTITNGGEAAIGITTQESSQEGHGLKISTGDQGSNPFRSFGGTSGVLSGSAITMALAALAAVFVIWREESGVIEA